MPEELAKSLQALVPAFTKLEKALIEDREELRTDRSERRWFLRGMGIAAILILILVALVTFLVIYFHSSTSHENANNEKIIACVYPPKKASPPDTPINKLSCYERGQIESVSEVLAILQYQRNLDQATINHLMPGTKFQLPQPTFSFPKNS